MTFEIVAGGSGGGFYTHMPACDQAQPQSIVFLFATGVKWVPCIKRRPACVGTFCAPFGWRGLREGFKAKVVLGDKRSRF